MNQIKVIRGDITQQTVDAIVNAAKNSLMGGAGVDGAIHRAGGPAILEACKKIVAIQGVCKTGEAVITTGGNLPARFVIHTVGPVWHGGGNKEAEQLENCYVNSLRHAEENKLRSVAFPNISTGAYGFPKDLAAGIAVKAVSQFLKNHAFPETVIFICFDEENFSLITQGVHELKRSAQ